jgi:hypothetical protein
MTAPATFNTPLRIITYAMRDAGLLQEGEDPNPDQLAENSNRLNDLINLELVSPGLKLWLWEDLPITLTAGNNNYTLGPTGNVPMTKPLRAMQGYYNDLTIPSSPARRPLISLSWNEWLTLSTVAQQGPISQYFVDKQQTYLSVHFWLTPDSTTAANGTANLLVEQQATNFTGVTDTMNFPQEWYMYLRWGLADEISTGQPPTIVQKCAANAVRYKDLLENWDVEDASVMFQSDSRAGHYHSRFR